MGAIFHLRGSTGTGWVLAFAQNTWHARLLVLSQVKGSGLIGQQLNRTSTPWSRRGQPCAAPHKLMYRNWGQISRHSMGRIDAHVRNMQLRSRYIRQHAAYTRYSIYQGRMSCDLQLHQTKGYPTLCYPRPGQTRCFLAIAPTRRPRAAPAAAAPVSSSSSPAAAPPPLPPPTCSQQSKVTTDPASTDADMSDLLLAG